MKKLSLKNLPLSRKFFLSYILMVVLFVVFLIPTNYLLTNILVESVTEITISDIEKTAKIFNSKVDEFVQITHSLSRSDSVHEMLSGQLSDEDAYEVIKDDIPRYYSNLSFVGELYLWHSASGNAFMNNSLIKQVHQWPYEHYNINGIPYSEFFETMSNQVISYTILPVEVEYITSKTTQYMFCGKYTVVNDNIEDTITAFITINKLELEELFAFSQFEHGGDFYISDSKDKLVYSSNESVSKLPLFSETPYGENSIFSNNSYVFTYKEGAFLYTLSVPMSYFNEQTGDYIRLMVMIALLLVFFGVIVAIILSASSSKPIKQIVAMLDDDDKQLFNNEYTVITNSITKFKLNKVELENRIKEYSIVRKSEFFTRLLRGDIYTETQLTEAMHSIGLSALGDKKIVVYLKFSDVKAESEIPEFFILSESVLTFVPSSLYIHSLSNDECVVFCEFNDDEFDKTIEDFSKLCNSLINEYSIDILCGVGVEIASLLDADKSYYSARVAVEQHLLNEDKFLIIADDTHLTNKIWQVTTEFSNELDSLIKLGESEKISDMIVNFFARNKNYSLPDKIKFERMKSDFINIYQDVSKGYINTEKFQLFKEHVNSIRNIEVFEENVIEIFTNVSKEIRQKNSKSKFDLYEKIMKFIDENFSDSSISLCSIADEFKLSEKYISRFIKEHNGESFQSLLENTRMAQALEMMKNENLSITEIATNCGYLSHNSFYKAFKRLYGMSPAQYRKSIEK